MSYDAYLHLPLDLRAGTTVDQVETALAPLLEIWPGLDGDAFSSGATYDPNTGDLLVQVTGNVPNSFADSVFAPCVRALGELVDAPFAAELINESTGDRENAVTRLVAGPAHLLAEFNSNEARYVIVPHISAVCLPQGSTGLTIEEIVASEAVELGITEPLGLEPAPRLSMNLVGLDLSDQQRKDAAHLLVLLARTLGGDRAVHAESTAPARDALDLATADSDSAERPRG